MKITQITKNTVLEESGIYVIRNLVNKKVYIGQATNIYRRWIVHKSNLLNNNHENSHLQNSFNKYGQNFFDFSVLEYCNSNLLTEKEKYYISIQENQLYNIREASEHFGSSKKVLSEETKKKISDSLKGRQPKNLSVFQQSNVRKVAYYINNQLITIFNSCKEAAEFFNMKPNLFNQYIGRIFKQKSKYFEEGTKLEYYE